MKKYLSFLLLAFILQQNIAAQYISTDDIQPAPEIWSEPEPLDSIFADYFHYETSPALTKGFDTLYYQRGDGICVSYKVNDYWSEPQMIFKDGTLRGVSLSKDGKRIYFSGWGGYGSWDLWYMDWDADSTKWNWPLNMGPEINSDYGDEYLYEINKDTIYVINHSGFGNVYHWNSDSTKWILSDELYNNDYQHPFAYWGDIFGLSITGNGNKLYFAHRFWPDYELDSIPATEIYVTYKDTVTKKWGNIFSLNINCYGIKVDTLNNIFIGGGDDYPWISPDGKVLVFSTNRGRISEPQAWEDQNNKPDLYISYLLVDENGDSVTSVAKNKNPINSFCLRQNYPNPFNPETTILYQLDEEKNIKLTLYDSIGRLVKRLDEGRKPSGEYRIKINASASGLSSGVYYCVLSSGFNSSTIKLIYLK